MIKALKSIFSKYELYLLALLKPLGVWGIGALALVDAASIAIPIDLLVAGYVWNDRARFWLYCLSAALGSALGSLVPYFVGRAGGELFLLKRINRVRFEKMRDRFERQEFLAIMIPAMMPPPTPIKLFEFSAGVFEMKPFWFATAIFSGRFLRFMAVALLTLRYGPDIVHIAMAAFTQHLSVILEIFGLILLGILIVVLRKMLAKRNGANRR
ncbi:MAG: YqaA family protein [Acidobacteriaceae bacterium]